jgi:hypothetical protein
MDTPVTFSFVSINKIRNRQYLAAMQNHAQRLDQTGKDRQREGADWRDNLGWPYGDDMGFKPFDCFERFIEKTGAVETKGAPLGFHMIVGLSPDWVKAKGDLHDPKNTANKELFAAAIDWANEAFGDGAVYNARMDLDEVGGAVVDVFVTPTTLGGGKHNKKLKISTHKAVRRLADKHQVKHGRLEFSAIQDDFGDYCKTYLDPTIQRGRPKKETGAKRLTAEEYGTWKDKAREEEARLIEEVRPRVQAMALEAIDRAVAKAEVEIYEKLESLADKIDQGKVLDILAPTEAGYQKIDGLDGDLQPLLSETEDRAAFVDQFKKGWRTLARFGRMMINIITQQPDKTAREAIDASCLEI